MPIASLIHSPDKFLGPRITFKGKYKDIYKFIEKGITDCLKNIDETVIAKNHSYMKSPLLTIRC